MRDEAKLDRLLAQAKSQDAEMDALYEQFIFAYVYPLLQSNSTTDKKYQLWLDESVALLHERGYLTKQADGSSFANKPPMPLDDIWQQWQQQREKWINSANKKATVLLAEACLRAIPDILGGKAKATDVIFPEASMELVQGIYKDNVISDLYNDTLHEKLLAYIEVLLEHSHITELRLLEIGAGTGGTTAGLLPKLTPFQSHIKEYCYTDISNHFLMHAEQYYAPQAPYLRTRIFDVERNISEQGIQADNYDAVIATNVLHTTKNIRQTLRNAKASLHRGGILLINEVSEKTLFLHITFGLLEGWWRYEDPSLRIPGSPILRPEQWKKVLKEEGFDLVLFPAEKIHALGQQVIIAKSDGVVRQEVVGVQNLHNNKVEGEASEEVHVFHTAEKQDWNELTGKCTSYVIKLIADTLKMKAHELEVSKPLEDYGIDSIVVVRLSNALGKVFDGISSTLFFEVQTIEGLVAYLLKTQEETCLRLVGLEQRKLVKNGSAKLEQKKQASKSKALSVENASEKEPLVNDKGRQESAPVITQRLTEISMDNSVRDVAVIGLSGRYPRADTLEEFWTNLKEGKDCISEVPGDRWNWKKYFDAEKGKEGKTYSKWGGFLNAVDNFDPLFFNISPREAVNIDPQERLFLEEAYKSIEDAGYTPQGLSESRKVGVFVGVMNGDYAHQSQYWSIANRVSYHLNFQGPSIAVDTACSSSLTAIHLALESLYSGTSQCAIAGGVNLILTPQHLINLSSINMLSSGSACKSFGDEADGFVDGEGVGAVVLKPLAKAISDKDHIYGLIKGSMLNAGGKTNGYTVPNPNAQNDLISETLKRANIDARVVSYIEAHGTGTKLGDPIEISGLTRAFENYTKERQYCAIGSIKSNIGHCESAAGIAGVTKVLLQMRYGQIVPSLHSSNLNPHIDFEKTPFIVNRLLSEWKRPLVDGKTRPRIAGISSFGAGGANAHLLIEEYLANNNVVTQPAPEIYPLLFPLSAKNEERLKIYAQVLLDFVQANVRAKAGSESTHDPARVELADLAFTLQLGREAMEERIALLVHSRAELIEKIQAYLKGEIEDTEGLFYGQVKRNKEALSVFRADEDMAAMLKAWINKGKYEKLLELWVKGLIFDWCSLYETYAEDHKPKRISAPTYPFARESYWKDRQETQAQPSMQEGNPWLHPLLHANTSDFSEQRYTSKFTGQEFIFTDYKLFDLSLLPGMAYLEMACAAIQDVLRSSCGIQLTNIRWASPQLMEHPGKALHISLYPEVDGAISYDIYSIAEQEDECVVHAQGTVMALASAEPVFVDVSELQTRYRPTRISNPVEYYRVFRDQRLDYGSEFQCLEKIFTADEGVLVKINIVSKTQGQSELDKRFTLDPRVMELIIQGLMIADIDRDGSSYPMLPQTLDSLEIITQGDEIHWLSIRGTDQTPAKYDVDLLDRNGRVCVTMHGLSTYRLDEELSQVFFEAKRAALTTFKPVWDAFAIEGTVIAPARNARTLVIGASVEQSKEIQGVYPNSQVLELPVGATAETLCRKLEDLGDLEHLIWISPHQRPAQNSALLDTLIDDQNTGVLQLFSLVKAVIDLGYDAKSLAWTLITTQTQKVGISEQVHPAHASIHGLSGSMAKEFPLWKIRLVDLENNSPWPYKQIFLLPFNPRGDALAYRDKEWYTQRLISIRWPKQEPNYYRKSGVYVVIGGAGGLGAAWTEWMLKHYQANIVWLGRRAKDDVIEKRLHQLSRKGPAPTYIQCDACNRGSLEKALQQIKQRYSTIHGVINSAVGEFDLSLQKTDEQRFRSNLATKVNTSVLMAQVFGAKPLDFLVFFSSIQAFLKSPGFSSYASGCTFKDSFATYLTNAFPYEAKVINWGFWDLGSGSRVSEALKIRQAQAGVQPIEPDEGMSVLEALLNSPIPQVGVTKELRPSEEIHKGEWLSYYRDSIPSIMSGEKSYVLDKLDLNVAEAGMQRGEMEKPLCRLLWSILSSLGLFNESSFNVAELRKQGNILAFYDRWLHEVLNVFENQNYLHFDSDTDRYHRIKTDTQQLAQQWAEWNSEKWQWTQDENSKAHTKLLEACLHKLPEILVGKQKATEIMFPNSSMELVEVIYKGNAVADLFNTSLAETLSSCIEERLRKNISDKIHILEVGAGTGGTTAAVLPKLQEYKDSLAEYCYSDLSKAFLFHAEEKYAPGNCFISTEIFDITQPLATQNIQANRYDFIIATNVLHATHNIRRALRNVKATLRKNGVILINEICKKSLFAHLTFGLLEGWWLSEDNALRIPRFPGLHPQAWKKVLEEEGFRSVTFPAGDGEELGQLIVMAESDGVVRQQEASKPIPNTGDVYLNATLQRRHQRTAGPAARIVHSAPANVQQVSTTPIYSEVFAENSNAPVTEDDLKNKGLDYFKKLIAEVLRMSPSKLDAKEPLSSYGVDSILITQINSSLRELFDDVDSALLFEVQTIDGLLEYFIEHQRTTLIKILGLQTICSNQGFSRAAFTKASMASQTEPLTSIVAPLNMASRFTAQAPVAGRTMRVGRETPREPIAIIGVSGRYPKANNLQEYWQNLKTGKDCIDEIPEDRWSLGDFFNANKEEAIEQGKSYSKWGGFIDGFSEFDPLFFNLSPLEAVNTDPQERIFLQACWAVVEDAGYTRDRIASQHRGSVGVFVGITKTGFNLYGPDLWRKGERRFPRTSFCSVANRVSFLFNFNGPSKPVDTMCSSSLTAIHDACESLLQNECDMAIAGGVNLYLHPSNYVELCGMQMLSTDKQCRSFGLGGNGFVPGEGVGVVLLKRLSRALSDKDRIEALVRGSNINHGGRTNGYTVPNPRAQSELIREAFDKSGVDARTVTYIEAHGTGTQLGDPIEIRGLTQAFKKDSLEKEKATCNGSLDSDPLDNDSQGEVFKAYCYLGSVKSNIGHLEAAAGIAGLTKVLLQMRYQQIAPSLHSSTLNPHIDFAKTPFIVNQELIHWPRPIVDGKEFPRLAGISSFGAGGSNAHVLIEEYSVAAGSEAPESSQDPNPIIIILSAKQAVRLQVQAANLLDFLQQPEQADIHLADLAYTLQVGREAMDERLGMVVDSRAQLIEKLQHFVTDPEVEIDGLYRGRVKKNEQALQVFSADEDLQAAMVCWIEKKKYEKILDLWVKGLSLDWTKFYGDLLPRRISAPSYPFGKEKYWIVKDNANKFLSTHSPTSVHSDIATRSDEHLSFLHPLVQQNTSTLAEQQFTSYFNGDEFFLNEHRVNGNNVLPGVAYLEMARAAVQFSMPTMVGGNLQLKNVIWTRPIIVEKATDGSVPKTAGQAVHISLYPGNGSPENNSSIAYEIYTLAERDHGRIVHSQGNALWSSHGNLDRLDLQELQGRHQEKVFSSLACYRAFNNLGLEYGPGFQALDKVYVEPNSVLAKINMPPTIVGEKDKFLLHPSLMDAAFQSSIGLALVSEQPTSQALPFALESLVISAPCRESMWAWVRYSRGCSAADPVQKLDIDLCDDEGAICVKFRGFSSRMLDGKLGLLARDVGQQNHQEKAPPKNQQNANEVLMLKPVWQAEALMSSPLLARAQVPVDLEHHLIVFGFDAIANRLSTILPEQDVWLLSVDEHGFSFEKIIARVFQRIRNMLAAKPRTPKFLQVLIPNEGEKQLLASLSALLKTAGLENSKFVGQVISHTEDASPEEIAAIVKDNSYFTSQSQPAYQVRYQDHTRYVLSYEEVAAPNKIATIPWKDGGIYWITGGLGGLGLIFARDIAQKVKAATIMLTGRSLLSHEKAAQLDALKSLSVELEYHQLDVTDQYAVEQFVDSLKARRGRLDGIIHSAGIIRDNFIVNKSDEDFSAVLAPKVVGTRCIDQATRKYDLDFMVLFSSAASVLGNAGQADYTTANAFIDNFADYRNRLVAEKKRRGYTLAINWPLWREGGMRVNTQTEQMMHEALGQVAMSTAAGLQAFYNGVNLGPELSQVLIIEGQADKIRKALLVKPLQSVAPSVAQTTKTTGFCGTAVISDTDMQVKLQQMLMQSICKLLSLNLDDLDAETELTEYGFDSISFTSFTNQLNKQYQLKLMPTIFFEYPTIEYFAEYLAKEYYPVFARAFIPEEASTDILEAGTPASASVILPSRPIVDSRIQPRFAEMRNVEFNLSQEDAAEENAQKQDNAIAIVGMSGRFPMAEDIEALWENLKAEKHCIEEIPASRWDWQEIWGEPALGKSKTNIKWGGFIQGIDEFDPLFFGISPLEADTMDPQHRLLMTHVWQAMEDAGYSSGSLSGSNTALFIGMMGSGYGSVIAKANRAVEGHSATGLVSSMGPNRLSYLLNIHGPSEPIETACSSSLVAIHRAVIAIETKGCDQAFVGGINTIITPDAHISFSKAGMLSLDGRCKTFSKDADGYVRGEGIGILFLKPLRAAEEDGDSIYGLIRGSAENHGGRAASLTAPNPKAQSDLLVKAYQKGGIDPRTVSYIEAHGTGTSLGDPIEINGLKAAFNTLYENTGSTKIQALHCGIGSVKTNLGHLELAAGVAGVMKVLLQFKHKYLVKSLYCDEINPYISLENSPFYIVQESQPWQVLADADGQPIPRRAGVSSFGFGGVNAHVVLEEYVSDSSGHERKVIKELDSAVRVLIPLSAKSNERLRAYAQRLLDFVQRSKEKQEKIHLVDLAYTLQVGRDAMDERLGLLANSMADLECKLQAYLQGNSKSGEDVYCGQARKNQEALSIFNSDKNITKTFVSWVKAGQHNKLIELWVKGLTVDWNSLSDVLYQGNKPQRISAPTYPFASERYWVDEGLVDGEDGVAAKLDFTETPVSKVDGSLSDVDGSLIDADGSVLVRLKPVWNVVTPSFDDIKPQKSAITLVLGGTQEQLIQTRNIYPNAQRLAISAETLSDGSFTEHLRAKLAEYTTIDHILWIAPDSSPAIESLAQDQEQGVLQVFSLIKALLSLGYGSRNLFCTIITTATQAVHSTDQIRPAHAGIHGFIGSLAKEYSQWKIRLLDLEKDAPWPLKEMYCMADNAEGNALAYRNKQWFAQQLLPIKSLAKDTSGYRRAGVYVVIGGAGGIGSAWSQWMLENYQANIIWIGRRAKDNRIAEQLNRMSQFGATVHYVQADASDRTSLELAYQNIKQIYPEIHGVTNSALDTFDYSLEKTDENHFRKILSANVDVSINMAQVFEKEPLDFLLFFSSMAAFLKSAGFIGYASGCNFKDALALHLSQSRAYSVKVINWGYWSIGSGSRVSESMKVRQQRSGIKAIETNEGMLSLEQLVNSSFTQIGILKSSADLADIKQNDWLVSYPRSIPSILSPNIFSVLGDFELEKISGEMKTKEIEEPLCQLLWSTLQSLNIFSESRFTLSDAMSNGRIAAIYERWLKQVLSVFEEHHYLICTDGVYSVLQRDTLESNEQWRVWSQHKEQWSKEDKQSAYFKLLETCLRALPQVLTGMQAATEVIFPNASMALVEGLYKDNAVSDLFNNILGEALVTCIGERLREDAETELHIIEVGAGTGGTTATVLPKLQAYKTHIVEYCYTDLSKSFLFHAQEKFVPNNPFVETKIFNVEQPIAEQGIAADKYDFVIATNVLHATKNIRTTLRNVKATLRKNGILLLNEICSESLYAHLTFGLLDGWWLNEDDAIRIPGSPGLYLETWKRVLQEEGFTKVLFPVAEAHDMGQVIIAAQSDGIVRQSESVSSDDVTANRGRERASEAASRNRFVPEVSTAASENTGEIDNEILREKSAHYFKQLFGKILRIKSHQIDTTEPLESYGIDSILITQINGKLRELFDDVASTLLFEVQTVDALVDYFIETQRTSLIKLVGLSAPASRKESTISFHANTRTISATAATSVKQNDLSDKVSPEFSLPSSRSQGRDENLPIAIIGMNGRYPQANTLDEYWRNLKSGKNSVVEIPEERWSLEDFFIPDKDQALVQAKSYCKWGGFVDGFSEFDPLFFNISPREALVMDPQERLFLQSCWSVLEDAGYTKETIASRYQGMVGVFAGITRAGFNLYGPDLWRSGQYIFPNTSFSSTANRVSYQLDLHGPSMPIDTMCSSALSAIHEACESLRSQHCEMAIAGGVNLYLHPSSYITLSAQQMLSVDGQCKSFGQGGNGFVPGEGVGTVLLKPLNKAQQDGDHIEAVILASHVNHGGKTNGYTVPNPKAQTELIRKALDKSGINARSVSYIEAHGTGTELGDPIEIKGLTQAFHHDTKDTVFCYLGSVKSNIGHLEAAAGIAGVMKIILQMKNKALVPSLHAKQLNPHIDFSRTPFTVNQTLRPWEQPVIAGVRQERIAGISSFGAGGSNAHIILKEYVSTELVSETPMPVMIPLSAKNKDRLHVYAQALLSYVQANKTVSLANLAFTLQVGREAMDERLGLIVHSVKELEEKLIIFVSGREDEISTIEDCYRGHVKRNQGSLAISQGDEDVNHMIEAWVRKRKYGKLFDLWVNGLSFDWNILYPSTGAQAADTAMPRRISAPTYPFAKENYWLRVDSESKDINEGGSTSRPIVKTKISDRIQHSRMNGSSRDLERYGVESNISAAQKLVRKASWDNLSYVPRWELCEPTRATHAAARLPMNLLPMHLLLVSSERASEFENKLAEFYQQRHPNAQLIRISLSESTYKHSEHHWSCGIADNRGLHTCLASYDRIDAIYFLAEFSGCSDSFDMSDVIQSAERNELQLLRLYQFLSQQKKIADFAHCHVISVDNYRTDKTLPNAYGGGLTGLAYAIAQRDHRFLIRNIDLSMEDVLLEENHPRLFNMIINEPHSDRGELIKYSLGRRYRRSFLKLNWNLSRDTPTFRTGGVYVILGGSGYVGQAITRSLIQEYQAEVIWLGRASATSASIQKKRQSFSNLGKIPHYFQADSTNADSIANAVKSIKKIKSKIHGAIYSAMVVNTQNSVVETSEKEFLDVFDVKGKGGCVFYQAFAEEPLDFMCFFSSAQAFSFTGATNMSGYATGITFADTFLHSIKAQANFPVGLINWGWWQSAVSGSGISIENLNTIEDFEGFKCFERFVGNLRSDNAIPQVVCLGVSEPVKKLMNIKEGEALAIAEKRSQSFLEFMLNGSARTMEFENVN